MNDRCAMSDKLFCKLYMNIHCILFTFVKSFSNIKNGKWKQVVKTYFVSGKIKELKKRPFPARKTATKNICRDFSECMRRYCTETFPNGLLIMGGIKLDPDTQEHPGLARWADSSI